MGGNRAAATARFRCDSSVVALGTALAMAVPIMAKLPRKEVIEGALEIVKETFEGVDDQLLDELRGGQMQARYGIIIPKKPPTTTQPGQPAQPPQPGPGPLCPPTATDPAKTE